MNFLHSMDQRLLADTVSSALAGAAPEKAPDVLAGLDAFRLMVPEDRGGSGLGLVEGAILMEAAGRAGIRLPLAATILLADALGADAPDRAAAIASGGLMIDIAGPGCLVERGGRLSGALGTRIVAGLGWIAAPVGGDALVAVPVAGLRGADRHAIEPDERAMLAKFDLPATAPRLAVPAHADSMAVLHCAELLGAAGHTFDLSVSYLKERVQFGQPIGANQALKHMAADAYMMLENARVAVEYAAAALDAARVAPEDAALCGAARRAVDVMLGYVPGATRELAETAIQFHGGIGLTWEYQLNGYLRRIIRLGMGLGHEAPRRRALLDGGLTPGARQPAAANAEHRDRSIA